MNDDLNLRRLTLGDDIRLQRDGAGVSGKSLAARLGWPASKISRIERAKQSVSDTDLFAIGRELGLPSEVVEDWRTELRAIRIEEARWNKQFRVGHRVIPESVAKAETGVSTIRVFSLLLIPGLVQTAAYARDVVESVSELRESPRDAEQATRARMSRQDVLYDESRTIELLMTEASLRYPRGTPSLMLAQVDRLISLEGLEALRLGIVPFGARLPAAVSHDFVIRDAVVTVELINTEVTTSEPAEVALYSNYLDQVWAQAAEGDQARAILTEYAAKFRDQL